MRIKINFTQTNEVLNINNQEIVNSYIHKCLGKNNEYHNSKNNYNVSMLMGGTLTDDKKFVMYKNGAYIIISSLDMEFINKILIGSMNNLVFYKDMKFKHIEYINEDLISGWNNFHTVSPFIIKKYINKKQYTFSKITDSDFKDVVKSHIINKVSKIISNADTSKIDVIIHEHKSNKVKKCIIHGVENYGNRCNISIKCDKNIAELLYNIGLGQSCGSGFGCLCKTENIKLYKNQIELKK